MCGGTVVSAVVQESEIHPLRNARGKACAVLALKGVASGPYEGSESIRYPVDNGER